jgi:hypothetical protein
MNRHVKFKWMGTLDSKERKLRLCRWTWATGDDPTVKDWHSSALQISLCPKILMIQPELWGWAITICGLKIHRKRAYGGWL